MLNNDFETNQTRFALEEPVLENVMKVDQEFDQREEESLIAPKKKSKKIVLVGMVGLILIVVFILLLILVRLNSNGQKELEKIREKIAVEEVGELSPLLREVYDLGISLKVADPALNSISSPPLDMELRLEDRKR